MRIRVEMVSGRSVSGEVDDIVESMQIAPCRSSGRRWEGPLHLVGEDGRRHLVNLAHVETIVELPE